MDEGITVRLDGLPADRFHRAVTYLDDTLRECQLMLVGPPPAPDDRAAQDLHQLARALVPDIEEIRAAFRSGTFEVEDDRVSLHVTAVPALASTMIHLQSQIVQLRLVGRRGALMTESDPEVTSLLAWIWDEAADQLHGREPRSFRRTSDD